MAKHLALTLMMLSAPGLAQPVPANLYECKGEGVTVTYSTTSVTGQPSITFQWGKTVISRTGNEIQTQATVLGNLVTIAKPSLPEVFSDTLTLLAPDVNISERLGSVDFTTRLFSTRTRTSLGGPQFVEGLIQRNTSQLLLCSASAVAF